MVFNGGGTALNSHPPIIVIGGPTATGKSSVSIELAKSLNGEVVVADSMQVYKGMDIGTAKVPVSERCVLHHCIDLISPDEPFSSALYQTNAREAFESIHSRGKRIILSGGTGFYIRSAVDDYKFPDGEQLDNPLRKTHEAILSKKGPQALWEMLDELDHESAMDIHPNNSKRVSRALELHSQGKSYHQQKLALSNISCLYDCIFICLDVRRDVLLDRIESRVEKMFKDGLVDEVKALLDAGYRKAVTANAAIGYKEVVDALDGKCTLEDAASSINIATRRYAKRQSSWFRNDSRYIHVDVTDMDTPNIAHTIETIVSKHYH